MLHPRIFLLQVEYGVPDAYGLMSDADIALATSHEIFLTNLEPGVTYHFRVRSKNVIGNVAFSEDFIFTTPEEKIFEGGRGQASICGWDGDSLERVDTFCATGDGVARGESWTASCSAVWGQTTSRPVQECIYQFSGVSALATIAANEPWQVAVEPVYTGWVDILVVESPSGNDQFLPAAQYVDEGQLTMDALSLTGNYIFQFRPADDSAFWSDSLTVTVK